MKVFLHIGTPKTGTSSIQQTCARHRDALLAENVMYPNVGNMNRHSILSVPFLDQGVPREFWSKFGRDKAEVDALVHTMWEDLFSAVAISRPDVLVLSGERLINISDFDGIQKKISNLQGITSVEVLCYLRHPYDHYLSAAQQVLKASFRTKDFATHRWDEALNSWAKIGNLTLKEFNRSLFRKSDIVVDFLDTVAGKPLPEVKPVHVNESMSAEAMVIVQRFRRDQFSNEDNVFNAPTNRLMAALQAVAATMPAEVAPTKPHLTEEAKEGVLRANIETVRNLDNSFDFQFSDADLYDTDIIPTEVDRTDRPSSIEDVISVDPRRVEALYSAVLSHLMNDL